MKKNEGHIVVDIKTHKIVKLEAVKREISMKKLVHDAVIEYLKRHKIEVNDLTPAKKILKKEDSIMDFINIKKKLAKN